jgi:hypothetical protein
MTGIPQISSNPALTEHAAEIRRLGKRVIADVTTIVTTTAIEIGRHLTEAKAKAGHGHFGRWLLQEFEDDKDEAFARRVVGIVTGRSRGHPRPSA